MSVATRHVFRLLLLCQDCCLIGEEASMPSAGVVRSRLLKAQANGVDPAWMYAEVNRQHPGWLPAWDEVKPV